MAHHVLEPTTSFGQTYYDVYDMDHNEIVCRCTLHANAKKIAQLLDKDRAEKLALREGLMN